MFKKYIKRIIRENRIHDVAEEISDPKHDIKNIKEGINNIHEQLRALQDYLGIHIQQNYRKYEIKETKNMTGNITTHVTTPSTGQLR